MSGSGRAPLRVDIAGIRLSSPLILASGILGITAESMARVGRSGAGAVTTKSFSVEPREGHKNPCVVPFDHGIINAVGLANPGAEAMNREVVRFRALSNVAVFASVFGGTEEEFGRAVELATEARPDLIELNVSCPNVASEFGAPFGSRFETTAAVTRLAKQKAGSIPIAVKLTVNCPSIGEMARICEANGADAITAINTIGPGMLLDENVARPVLSNKVGGVSGPAILPIAVRAVWEIYRSVRIPIIGTGGVTSSRAAVQLMLAGARAVGIGSAVYYEGISVFEKINRGITQFLDERGYRSVLDIVGCAHNDLRRSSVSI
jgi:dihydroorotate dehydrogenase (NAD+) catalytic subunit